MSAGFTPGPWNASIPMSDSFGPVIYTSDGFDPLDAIELSEDAANANAHLIAAAPDLYGWAERVLGDLSATSSDEIDALQVEGMALLAKARGERVQS